MKCGLTISLLAVLLTLYMGCADIKRMPLPMINYKDCNHPPCYRTSVEKRDSTRALKRFYEGSYQLLITKADTLLKKNLTLPKFKNLTSSPSERGNIEPFIHATLEVLDDNRVLYVNCNDNTIYNVTNSEELVKLVCESRFSTQLDKDKEYPKYRRRGYYAFDAVSQRGRIELNIESHESIVMEFFKEGEDLIVDAINSTSCDTMFGFNLRFKYVALQIGEKPMMKPMYNRIGLDSVVYQGYKRLYYEKDSIILREDLREPASIKTW